MKSAEIHETLRRQVRDELYRVHVGGHGDGCPQCIRIEGGSVWDGCPVIDEYMIDRVISTVSAGLQGMAIAVQREQTNQPATSITSTVVVVP